MPKTVLQAAARVKNPRTLELPASKNSRSQIFMYLSIPFDTWRKKKSYGLLKYNDLRLEITWLAAKIRVSC